MAERRTKEERRSALASEAIELLCLVASLLSLVELLVEAHANLTILSLPHNRSISAPTKAVTSNGVIRLTTLPTDGTT